ncbi:Rtr1/RPAP2 family-domain-containing protein [Coniochaeta sp. 2T2.1]|nr:Rtr1/RPAP2 family-domain-containing protein [Coniochaeta sp. 2T2.1]
MASQIQRELKSILKPARSSHPTPAVPSPEEAERIALHHARILQQQKNLELQILDAIDTLSTYPLIRSPTFTSANPPPQDVATFKSLIRPFQPSDYDDLIEERNILGNCGYALCPNKKRTDSGGVFTLVNHNTPDFAIVPTKDVKKWCSDKCARRALYVKVQLNETAAWERVAMPDMRIDLMDEEGNTTKQPRPESAATPVSTIDATSASNSTKTDEEVARDLADHKLEEERKAKSVKAALSLERGDVIHRGEEEKARLVPLGPKMDLTIREKEVTGTAKAPELEGEGEENVEGHVTRFRNQVLREAEEEDGEDEDEDEGYGED